MNWKEHITANSNICHGKPCLRGTRIPISTLLDNLAAGHSYEEIKKSYPGIERNHIHAAIAYAAELSRDQIIQVPA